jgi:hypothetical protein
MVDPNSLFNSEWWFFALSKTRGEIEGKGMIRGWFNTAVITEFLHPATDLK